MKNIENDRKVNLTDTLSKSELSMIRALRDRGFAVVVWQPIEMTMLDEHMSVEDFEDAVCEAASDFLVNEGEWDAVYGDN